MSFVSFAVQNQSRRKPLKPFDTPETMGRRFRRFRTLFDISSEDLAEALDRPVGFIREIETGKREPDIFLLVYLEKTYGLDINWLLTGHPGLIPWEGYRGGFPPEDVKVFLESRGIPYKEEEHGELLRLMQVPEVFILISSRVLEAGILFRPQIREKLVKKGDTG